MRAQYSFIFALLMLSLTACETFTALTTTEKPQTYKETIFVLEEDIKAARDVTALLARTCNLNGVCRITRTQAKAFSKQTKEMLSYIDTIWVSISLVGGDLSKCRLVYEGIELPCNSASDKMLFILLKIQSELQEVE